MLRYNSTIIGTLTLVQYQQDEEKPRKFKIQIRQGNCLAVFLYVYKEEHPEDPKRPYIHQLCGFLADEAHLKDCFKEWKSWVFPSLFMSTKEIENIRLNLYYKEAKTLLKYMVKDGLKVQCYYKEPKGKK